MESVARVLGPSAIICVEDERLVLGHLRVVVPRMAWRIVQRQVKAHAALVEVVAAFHQLPQMGFELGSLAACEHRKSDMDGNCQHRLT